MAGFLYEAAMADERVPRKPIPAAPSQLKQQRLKLETEKEHRQRERDARQVLDTKAYGI